MGKRDETGAGVRQRQGDLGGAKRCCSLRETMPCDNAIWEISKRFSRFCDLGRGYGGSWSLQIVYKSSRSELRMSVNHWGRRDGRGLFEEPCMRD